MALLAAECAFSQEGPKTTCFCFPDTSGNQTPLQQNLNKLGGRAGSRWDAAGMEEPRQHGTRRTPLPGSCVSSSLDFHDLGSLFNDVLAGILP